MTEISKPNYLARAKKLSEDEAERLFSRMTGKLPRRLEKDKLSKVEALATRVLFEGKRATGVEYRQGGTTRTARAARAVIHICGGPGAGERATGPAAVGGLGICGHGWPCLLVGGSGLEGVRFGGMV